MLAAGMTEAVAKEMEEYKIEVLALLALQEIRWKREGRIDTERYTIVYGGENKLGMERVL